MDNLYSLIVVILTALTPGVEARGAIPLALALGMNPVLGFIVAYVSSSIVSIPIIYLLETIELRIISKINLLNKIYSKLLSRIRVRSERIARHKLVYIALALYVAIPLPLTGVWTGSAIAYILGLEPRRSVAAVFIGNLIASTIIFTASYLLIIHLEPI